MEESVDLEDKIKGMLFGVALGDALGAPHEFRHSKAVYTGRLEHPTKILRRCKGYIMGTVGQVTDDTEMTLALARALLENNGKWVRDTILQNYISWANSGTANMGKHTRTLLKGIKTQRGFDSRWQKATQLPQKKWTQANGCLMRASPLAILANADAVILDCRLTHPHPVCVESVKIYVHVLRRLIEGECTGKNSLKGEFPKVIFCDFSQFF